MAKTQYLEYKVNLSDKALVTSLQAQFPNGRRIAPVSASSLYSAPFQLHDSPFSAPSLRSQWFGNNTKYPTNVAEFQICSGGWFGVCFLFGSRTNYIWVAKFVFVPPVVAEIEGVPTEQVAIARRKWLIGFETPVDGEMPGTAGTITGHVSRDASRHPDGLGLAIRGPQAGVLATVAQLGATASPRTWERFYMRMRVAPSANATFWFTQGSVSILAGAGLRISTAGVLSLINTDNVGVVTTMFTSGITLTVDQWYKFDCVFSYATGTGGAGAVFKLYVNGVLLVTQLYTSNAGLAQSGQNHFSSTLGFTTGVATVEFDFDDWIGSEWPSGETSSGRSTGKDFLNGSKVQLVKPTEFTSDFTAADWTGSVNHRTLMQVPGLNAGASMSSSVASAAIKVITDGNRKVDAQQSSLGMAAMTVILWADGTTADDGLLGYRMANGTLVLASVNQTTAAEFSAVMYRPAGVINPPPVHPLELHYVKPTLGTMLVRSLIAVCEVIGTFGSEDVTTEAVGTPTALTRRMGTHNAPYPSTPWARLGIAPQSPVVIHAGTYSGTGTGQDLFFRCPINWFWVRRTDAQQPPSNWWSSLVGSHFSSEQGINAAAVVQAEVDYTFTGAGDDNSSEQRSVIRFSGTDVRHNAVGGTYQFVAFEDPGMRFSNMGAFAHGSAVTSISNALVNAGFTPIAAFMRMEQTTTSVSALSFYKGPGHTTDRGSLIGSADQASVATLDLGAITSKVSLHAGTAQAGYAAFRRDDGSADEGRVRVVQMGSYIGNGGGARTISLTPASGRRPMFALVVPHNSRSYTRDPSHTSTNSSQADDGTTVATAITAGGIDEMIVGATLNTNLIVYDWFVIPGSVDACNNGWSCNGEFLPVEPDSPIDGPWTDPPDETDPEDPDEPDPDEPDPVEPVDPPDETEFIQESAASRAIRLANLCSRVLYRLGDSDEKIWTESEIDTYLQQAAFQMVTLTRLIWDQIYLENIPAGFHCNYSFEEDLLDNDFHYGVAVCTAEFELDYGEAAGLWVADDVRWANHTSPAELLYIANSGASTQMPATAELPRPLVHIERSVWDQMTMTALSTRDLIDNDSRFQITPGEPFGWTWRQDGARTFRKVQPPAQMANLMTTDGGFGIARNVEDADDTGSTGTWGIPRRIAGWHPMGSTVGFGLPRRFYYDTLNVKVEHWRKFEVACKMSNLVDGEIQRYAGEIPRHYFMYMADYCQWKALVRNGPGQNYKLAQLYADRWARNLGRLASRIARKDKERVGRLGGNDPAPRGRPPRPRLPWQYGSKVR